MRFSEDFIDKVRQANDIVEIIGQHTELKGSGHRLAGRCPFPDHSDKSPSFSIDVDQQLYHCFGCKKGGTVYTFLQTYNGMSFPEAIEFLARRASIPLPEGEAPKGPRKGPTRDQKDVLLRVNKLAAVFFHRQLKSLPADHPAKQYLAKRGLTDEIVEKFRIGVALDEWQGLIRFLQSQKVPLNLAEQLGLVKPKKAARGDDAYFDLFRDRLMFPIFSVTGDVIGFGGRTLGDGTPKYLNSPETPVFSKGRVLYGLHETGKYVRDESAIVVEGYMDAISLYGAGIKNVVAILGTAFTADHAKVLKRSTANVTMLLDGDEAGISGAERSLPILLEAGLMPKGFMVPEKMDPDDYVRANGAEKLKEEIARAPELFSLLLTRRWMADYHGSASEKVQVVESATPALTSMQNRGLQDLYILEIARQLDVEQGWVRRALSPTSRPKPTGPHGSPGRPVSAGATDPTSVSAMRDEPPAEEPEPEMMERIALKGVPRDEAFVTSLLLHQRDLMQEVMEKGPEEVIGLMSHKGLRDVLKWAFDRFRAQPDRYSELAASLASRVDHPAVVTCALEILPAETDGDQDTGALGRKLMTDYMRAIQQRFVKNQLRVLAGQLREEPTEDKLQKFMAIQRNRLMVPRGSTSDQ